MQAANHCSEPRTLARSFALLADPWPLADVIWGGQLWSCHAKTTIAKTSKQVVGMHNAAVPQGCMIEESAVGCKPGETAVSEAR